MAQRRVSGWYVSVACNSWRNGSFAGRADAFKLQAPDGSTVLAFGDGRSVRFDVGPGWIRLGSEAKGHRFRARGAITWHGNWCWNSYRLSDRDAARMLRLLWAWHEGRSEEGLCAFIARLEAGERPTTAWLAEVMAEVEREAAAYREEQAKSRAQADG